MNNYEIEDILMQSLSLDEVYVNNDGKHYDIIAIGKIFLNMNQVNKQKLIYSSLMECISDNFIHSISIRTYTPEEWKYKQRVK
ncbi:BolA family protein [Blochmannia endosymbiont of Camponotus (Colobopsis) obliquus]|uniref:BolA family protein n=1 Tax=Blochmannia endosymbiont of Camponotus (Colobopsis) obliquus TaxID=1505597 RepID=UPI00061A760B|nr:BolA/IbaG family iron-sulfur metabolism protein [Blochmannia endosymbiont of Camponotus (Colobopsis) obliquus]AKC60227.1 Uncharacterized protein YrbA [Blochmannia endosymbiont of Camponotus (Colobopsis) obliquus]